MALRFGLDREHGVGPETGWDLRWKSDRDPVVIECWYPYVTGITHRLTWILRDTDEASTP
ncbi:MAG: hypothetical protein ABT940_01390 [Alphaproteobacteria bacterium]